jgi:hypothetical protein
LDVLGRRTTKKDLTSPKEPTYIGGDSPKLYTCLRVAASMKAGQKNWQMVLGLFGNW